MHARVRVRQKKILAKKSPPKKQKLPKKCFRPKKCFLTIFFYSSQKLKSIRLDFD